MGLHFKSTLQKPFSIWILCWRLDSLYKVIYISTHFPRNNDFWEFQRTLIALHSGNPMKMLFIVQIFMRCALYPLELIKLYELDFMFERILCLLTLSEKEHDANELVQSSHREIRRKHVIQVHLINNECICLMAFDWSTLAQIRSFAYFIFFIIISFVCHKVLMCH